MLSTKQKAMMDYIIKGYELTSENALYERAMAFMKHPACPFKQHIRWDFEYYLRTKQDELLKSPNEYDKKAGELLKSLPLNTIILQGRNSWGRLSTNQRDCANYLVKRLRQINKPLEKAIEELSKPLPF